MRAGSLREKVYLDRATETRSGVDVVRSWSAYATVRASIEPLAGRELFEAQRLQSRANVRIIIRYYSGIKTTDRVRHAHTGAVYEIESIRDIETKHRDLELLCVDSGIIGTGTGTPSGAGSGTGTPAPTGSGTGTGDGLEVLTDYTEVDPESRFAVSRNGAVVTAIPQHDDAWLVKDFGAAHFGLNIQHDFAVKVDVAPAAGVFGVWCLSNIVREMEYFKDYYSEALAVWISGSTQKFFLENYEAGGGSDSTSFTFTLGTWYYARVLRPDETTVNVEWYSDAARTVLLDTLTRSVTSGLRYRYLMPLVSRNVGGLYPLSCEVASYSLNE